MRDLNPKQDSDKAQHKTSSKAAAQNQNVSVSPFLEMGIQRKASCACGGDCPRCESEQQKPRLQTKLKIGTPGDQYEQEADHAAERVMRMIDSGAQSSSAEGRVQRQAKRPALYQERFHAKRAGAVTSSQTEIPHIVHEVLASHGQPLDAATRGLMESGFGHDFGHLRIHTDARAAESANAVSAHAYTVGRDIVFASGQYAPGSEAGRRLLAHEIAHTLQQGGESVLLQRSCVASPCPPAPVPIDALFPRYEAAEKCIQEMYASTHPASKRGVSLSFNADWMHLTGGTPQEKLALGCARGEQTPGAGPNVTGKSGMFAAAPDIWDLRNTTMYEITTPSGAPFRVGKLGAEILNANRVCGTADCGGLHFDRGTWSPGIGCFALGGDLYFTASNNQGVIIYNMLKDATKELVMATLLAMMAAAMKQGGPKAGTAVAGQAVGKAVPAYAIASLAAMAILVASGRAEAKPGPGGEEPLVSLIKAMEQKGTPVPKEIQDMIEANPDLKEKMNKAMAEGGDPTKFQEEMNKQILDTIAANKDKFTAEELEVLLATTRVAGKALPKGNMTADELKKLAEAAKSGKTGGDGSGQGTGDKPSPDTPADKPKQDAGTPKPDDAGAKGAGDKGAGDKGAGDKQTAATPPSQTTKDNLAKAPAPVRDLFNSLLGSGPHAQQMSDTEMQRFLSMVPSTLTTDQLAKLRAKMKESTGQSVDQILNTLQNALATLDKPDPAKPADPAATPGDKPADKPGDKPADASAASDPATKPPETATLTTDPDATGAPADRQKLIDELTAKAKSSSFKDISAGAYNVSWMPDKPGQMAVGDKITGGLRGKLKDGKTVYVGRIEANITAVNGNKLKIKFTTVTPMVSTDGKVIFPASHFLGREDEVTLDPPRKKSK